MIHIFVIILSLALAGCVTKATYSIHHSPNFFISKGADKATYLSGRKFKCLHR